MSKPDKVIRTRTHDWEWKPKPDCRAKLHRLANKRTRRAAKKETET